MGKHFGQILSIIDAGLISSKKHVSIDVTVSNIVSVHRCIYSLQVYYKFIYNFWFFNMCKLSWHIKMILTIIVIIAMLRVWNNQLCQYHYCHITNRNTHKCTDTHTQMYIHSYNMYIHSTQEIETMEWCWDHIPIKQRPAIHLEAVLE